MITSPHNKLCIIFLMMIFAIRICAQHQNVYSNYLLNATSINPAATGKDEALDLNIYSRKQWSGFDRSPFTSYIGLTVMIKKPSLNVGLLVQDDEIGFMKSQNILATYAYRIKFKKFKLSLGIQAGVQLLNYNLDKLQKVTENDQVVINNQSNRISFINGFGLYIHNTNFYGSFSMPYLYSNGGFNLGKTPIYTSIGFILKIRNEDLIKPSILVRKIDGTNLTTDINIMYYYKSKYGIGFSYRHKNAIVAMIELVLNEQIKLAYSYEYSTTIIKKFQNGSHEVSLRYLFGKKNNIKNPRALYF